jgi:hypothetical protein
MTLRPPALTLTHVHLPAGATGPESTAAVELARLTGAALSGVTAAGAGVTLSLASRQWARPAGTDGHDAWMWLRLDDQGRGEIVASHGSFLFAAVRLLAQGLPDTAREKLGAGLLLPATFRWHRPHFDACLTQYWRSARDFDPEPYVAALAEFGFTHLEVNGLQAHMPYEDSVAFEYYSQFYTYCAGFNHFVATELTRGFWPNHYLDANIGQPDANSPTWANGTASSPACSCLSRAVSPIAFSKNTRPCAARASTILSARACHATPSRRITPWSCVTTARPSKVS